MMIEKDGTPEPEQLFDISGPTGETLFSHAIEHVVVQHHSEFQAELDEIWAHYKDISDERLLALVGALCVERSIQGILEALSPGFDTLQDDSAFTFSLKIKTVRAMRIIPSRVLAACDLIRQIRNEFAHHLDKKGFSQLSSEKYLNKMKMQVHAFNATDRADAEPGETFKNLVNFTLMALGVYVKHVRRMREYLETAAFRQSFAEWSKGGQPL